MFQWCGKLVVEGVVNKERGGSDFDPGLPHNDHETLTISYMNPVGYLFLVVL